MEFIKKLIMWLGIYNYTTYLSYLNAFFGIMGINWILLGGSYIIPTIFLLLSGICDMFDGLISNTKKDRTICELKYGIQIDSLSDIISFGCLPVGISYVLFKNSCVSELLYFKIIFSLVTSFYVLAALVRLAHFNVVSEQNLFDQKKKNYKFIGIPVPVSAIIFPSLVLFLELSQKYYNSFSQFILLAYFIIEFILIFLFLSKKIKIKKIKNIFLQIFSLAAFILIVVLLCLGFL